MSDSTRMQLGGEEYVVQPGEGVLRIGRPSDDGVTWLDDVDLGLLPAPAREALERGDHSDGSLETALRGIVGAQVNRGG